MELDNPIPAVEERLSDGLRRMLGVAAGRPLAVREMVEIMHGRGLYMMIMLLCLPFLTPVTIPGISIPFGLAIAMCGFRIAFGHKPWLPAFVMKRRVSYAVLEKMVRLGCAIYEKLEKIIRPRLEIVFDGPGMNLLVGLAIALAGVLLSLPIPPPFPLTNTIPGFAIIFFSLGLMERDGILVVLGYFCTILSAAYVAIIVLAGQAGIESLWRIFTGG